MVTERNGSSSGQSSLSRLDLFGRDCPVPSQRRRPYLLFPAARKQAQDHDQSWSARLACSSARPAPRSASGAPISQADPSTAGRPPMIGATEPSSPAAWPVSVRYPGSSAGWEVPGSCQGGGAGSSSGGVDLVGSVSVMLAISLGEHIRGPARKRWPSLSRRDRIQPRPIHRQLGLPPGVAPNRAVGAALQPAASRSASTGGSSMSAVRRFRLIALRLELVALRSGFL